YRLAVAVTHYGHGQKRSGRDRLLLGPRSEGQARTDQSGQIERASHLYYFTETPELHARPAADSTLGEPSPGPPFHPPREGGCGSNHSMKVLAEASDLDAPESLSLTLVVR